MKKLTFEIRSPAHQQNAIHAVQQILPDPTKPIVVTIQERNRSLDQNRKLWACLGDVSRQVEWHGRWLDAESWKCVFTAALKQQDVVPNLAGNGFVVIGQSTSRMRVSEFAELLVNRPGFPGECFICELRLPDHRFRWKHNKLFLLLPEEYGPAFPAIVDCYTSPPT